MQRYQRKHLGIWFLIPGGSTGKATRSIADAFEQPSDLRVEIFAMQIAGEANCILANRIGAEPRQLFGFALANLHAIRRLSLAWRLQRRVPLVGRVFHAQTFHEALDLRPQIFALQIAGEASCILANRIGAEPRQLSGFALANLHAIRRLSLAWGLERRVLLLIRVFRAQTFHEALD